MKDTINLIYNKIIGALPPLKEANAEIYRLQVLVLLRIIAAAGIKRVIATPDEIDQLLTVGKSLGHNVDDLLLIVKPSTYKNWLRRKKGGEVIKRPGRKKRISQEIIQLVLRLVKENSGWGIFRIVGELRKLGVGIARATIYKICKDHGQRPPPVYSKRFPMYK